jgi:hypothetical protein
LGSALEKKKLVPMKFWTGTWQGKGGGGGGKRGRGGGGVAEAV